MSESKKRISELLMEEFGVLCCDYCKHYETYKCKLCVCEDDRWSLSKEKADQIATKIIEEIE